MDNRALGKGLSALIPDKAGDSTKESIAFLDTNSIKDNKFQPRINYDDTKLNELKASIKEKGVLQPILVRAKGDHFEVVAGERRLRAARLLKLEKVPAIIKEVTDQEALVIALVENIQREELNPIEEAQAFKKLVDDFQYTQETIAQAVGKDRSTITNYLRLLNLPENIKKGVFDGEISVGHARTLLSIDSQSEKNRLFELTIRKALSVRELENLVKTKVKGGSRKVKGKDTTSHEIIALEEDLQKILGTKVRVKTAKKRGKIVIEYYSLDDLDRIIRIIKK